MKILLTGFEPFGGETINPSGKVVGRVESEGVAGVELRTSILPVAFSKASHALMRLIAQDPPDAVLMLGEAGGRMQVNIERIAVNFVDARIPDNDGDQPRDKAVIDGAPDAYFTSLPVSRIAAAICAQGIPATVSMSAGTYVCNHIFFAVRHLTESQFPAVRAGFIHLPYAPEQTVGKQKMPSLSLDLASAAIRTALECIRDDQK